MVADSRWGKYSRVRTRELDLLDELKSLVFGRNVVSFNSVVHEPDLDTVLIEQRGGISDSRENTGPASVY